MRQGTVMQTRKYPRTMREAFGPYVDNRLEPMRDKPLEPPERRQQDISRMLQSDRDNIVKTIESLT